MSDQIVQELILKPDDPQAWDSFLSLDSGSDFSKFNPQLAETIVSALDNRDLPYEVKSWLIYWLWSFSNHNKWARPILADANWEDFLTEPLWAEDVDWYETSPRRVSVSVVNNMSQTETSRRKLRKKNIVDPLLPLAQNSEFSGKASATMALLYLCGADEEISPGIIELCGSSINLFMGLLAEETTEIEAFGSSFDVSEIANALVCLSKSENNKKLFLPHIDTIFNLFKSQVAEYIDIQDEWLQILLQISFNEDILNQLRLKNVGNAIRPLVSSPNKVASELAKGLLFKLNEYESKAPQVGKSRHIMISYNWTHQPTIKKVVQRLKEDNFPVWFDLDLMGGSTLEAMAEAIEAADLVLIGVSPQYKESANCRLEAEYAFNTKKLFVPMMMDTSWKPTGWLGALLGTKLWFDFSKDDEEKFEASYQNLKKEIQQKHGITPETLRGGSRAVSEQAVPPKPLTKEAEAAKWDCERVVKWLEEPELSFLPLECRELFRLQEVDGLTLMQMSKWSAVSSPLFFKSCQAVGIKTLGKISHFAVQLKKVTQV